MQTTRQQILDFVREHGEGSVRDLGAHLHLTPTGVRQHLAILQREGLLDSHELRGHVGRPALAAPHIPALQGLSAEERVQATCAVMREQDVVASWERDGDAGFLLVSTTCPFRDVAAGHPAVCAMDAALIGRLTGLRAEQRSTLAAGAACCAYRLTPEPMPTGGRPA
ncbi:MAG: ArsR family transcriptional regulator [Dehalococcoidia bacterium]|nr:ArsR family transcriptional regulator [Dehalococcoidia bacterium]